MRTSNRESQAPESTLDQPRAESGSILQRRAAPGASRLFEVPRSTSNLVPPCADRLRAYMDPIFDPEEGEASIVALMEHRFAAFHDVPHCVAYANGFWSLVSAIRALALPGCDEIVMPSLTYRRLADVAAWAGLRPRFCEVDGDSLTASVATMEPCISPRTALILPAHPIVGVLDAAGLTAMARHHRVPILFDAVESVYEVLPEGRIGRFGDAEVFSLHASKLLNGFEGGYVTTQDTQLAARLRAARDHGRGPGGLNARLSGLHAAAALAALDEVEAQVEHNRAIYLAYRRHFAGITGLAVRTFDETTRSSFKNILVEIDPDFWPLTRDDTVRALNAEGALARAYYAPPLHRKPMAYPHVPADLPLTDALAARFLLMPCGHFVSETDVAVIAGLMRRFARGRAA